MKSCKRVIEIICNKNYRMDFFVLLLSLVYYLFIILGKQIMEKDYIPYTDIAFWIKDIILLPIFYILIKLLFGYLSESYNLFFSSTNIIKNEISDKKFFVFCLTVIIVAWAVVWLACFPGLNTYDGISQLDQYLQGNISTHHPYLHTIFIVFCYYVGRFLFGKSTHSFFIVYSILQASGMALIFAYLLLELKQMNCRKVVRIILLAWIAFFPMNSMMSISSTKDTLFAGTFLLFMIQIVKIYWEKEVYLKSWKNVLAFSVITFLMCSMRNNAPYVFIFSIPFIIVLLKKKWKKSLILFISLLCIYKVYDGPFLDTMNVTRGDSREALSMLIQPLSRVYNLKHEELSEEDIQNITTIIRGGEVFDYHSHISDPMKVVFDTDSFMDSKMKYVKTFMLLGIKYPDVYMDSFLAMTYGDWYPFEELPDYKDGRFYFEFPEALTQEGSGSKIIFLSCFLNQLTRYSSYLKIPGLCLLFATGSSIWVLLFICFNSVYRKEYEKLILSVPVWLLYGTISLGPVSLYRYIYPIVIVIPVLAIVSFQTAPRAVKINNNNL